ncbi:GNAT family N-acetyltransferase [Methylobacterium sp. SyP6R]|uniref:GNAT family N-acetyltransferase n=1 Tax=Methylobacterium sp. SyP6R TaxID=2718876 RepID=UPI001F27D538|nr:GNAT family N-acetyltransferase [Methylobacterium sp. SyP6R]MCF4129539.1 GNAT family N-acetyltransferase [Methylobacterium sp. SyP6R]
MTGFHLPPADGDARLARLRLISAQARERYRSIPALAGVADAPPLTEARFAACRVQIAVDDASGEIVGFAATRLLDGLLYLDNISVEADASGRGIGTALLDDVRARAVRVNAPAVTLTTFREPAWNGPWFRRHGFRPMPPERIGPGLRAVTDRQGRTFDPGTRETLWRPA